MTEPTPNIDEPTPLPEIDETITPLTDTLDDLATTVETASDRAASTVDDMQTAAEAAAGATAAAAEEAPGATVDAAGEVASEAVAAAGESLSTTIGAVEETTSVTATPVEEILTPVTGTVSEMAAVSEEYVEPAAAMPAAEELRATVDEMAARVATAAAVPPEVPPLPVPVAAAAAAAATGEVTSDDRLISALNWLGLVLLQLPLVSIVILLAEGNKNRPFQRHHAVQGLGFWVGAIVYEILATIVFTVGSIVTLGLGALCLWVIFFLPHLLALVYAWRAYQGKELSIPVVTKFMKQQGWLA